MPVSNAEVVSDRTQPVKTSLFITVKATSPAQNYVLQVWQFKDFINDFRERALHAKTSFSKNFHWLVSKRDNEVLLSICAAVAAAQLKELKDLKINEFAASLKDTKLVDVGGAESDYDAADQVYNKVELGPSIFSITAKAAFADYKPTGTLTLFCELAPAETVRPIVKPNLNSKDIVPYAILRDLNRTKQLEIQSANQLYYWKQFLTKLTKKPLSLEELKKLSGTYASSFYDKAETRNIISYMNEDSYADLTGWSCALLVRRDLAQCIEDYIDTFETELKITKDSTIEALKEKFLELPVPISFDKDKKQFVCRSRVAMTEDADDTFAGHKTILDQTAEIAALKKNLADAQITSNLQQAEIAQLNINLAAAKKNAAEKINRKFLMDFAADSDTAKGGGAADADAGNVDALAQDLTELSPSSAAETKALQAKIKSQKQQLDTERATAQAEIVSLQKTVATLQLKNDNAIVEKQTEEDNRQRLQEAHAQELERIKEVAAQNTKDAKDAAEALLKEQQQAAQKLQQDNAAKEKAYADRIADLELQLQAALAHVNKLVPLADSSKSSKVAATKKGKKGKAGAAAAAVVAKSNRASQLNSAAKIETLNESIAQLNESVASKDKEIAETQALLTSKQKEYEEQRQENNLAHLQEKMVFEASEQEKDAQIATLKATLRTVEKDFDDTYAINRTLKEQLDQNTEDAKQDDVETVRAELARTQKDWEADKQAFELVRQQNVDDAETIRRYQEFSIKANKQIVALKEKTERVDKDNIDLQGKVKEKEQELTTVRAQLANANLRAKNVGARNTELGVAIKRIAAKQKMLEARLETKTKEVATLQDDNNMLAETKLTQDGLVDSLQTQLHALNLKIEGSDATVAELREFQAQAAQKTKELQAEADAAKQETDQTRQEAAAIIKQAKSISKPPGGSANQSLSKSLKSPGRKKGKLPAGRRRQTTKPQNMTIDPGIPVPLETHASSVPLNFKTVPVTGINDDNDEVFHDTEESGGSELPVDALPGCYELKFGTSVLQGKYLGNGNFDVLVILNTGDTQIWRYSNVNINAPNLDSTSILQAVTNAAEPVQVIARHFHWNQTADKPTTQMVL